MASVTTRINNIKWPQNKDISSSWFKKEQYYDDKELFNCGILHGSVIGTVVDYLTRVAFGTPVDKAFASTLLGATIAELYASKFSFLKYYKGAREKVKEYLNNVKGLDEKSIFYACKLIEYNVWAKNPEGAINAFFNLAIYEPDDATIQDVITLVNRSKCFFESNGNLICNGFTFEPPNANEEDALRFRIEKNLNFGGYTPTVDSGDGDFLTNDTIWDLKVYKDPFIRKNIRLQVVMYWIMGQHSKQEKYKNITKVGIYNPRCNISYILDIEKVPKTTIKYIEDKIICYNERIPSKYEYDPICDIQIKLPD